MNFWLLSPSYSSISCASRLVPSVDRDQRLGLAAGEERRAVGAGQDADLDRDRPDLVEAPAVEADALVEHHLAQDLLLEVG